MSTRRGDSHFDADGRPRRNGGMGQTPRSLFRSEALEARHPRLTGNIVIAHPPAHSVLAAVAALFSIGTAAFMYFGT
jgi:hypothetical protein